jgi:mRNA-degrading endonuclease toxin of MazEF toxin-antitoxin module
MCEKSTKYARGTVWWVNTINDSMCSTSQKGRRPFLIISADEFNIRFGKVTVIPMSSQSKYDKYDYSVPTSIDGKVVYALVDQIRQMDIVHLLHYAYTINNVVLKDIDIILTKIYTNIKSNSCCQSKTYNTINSFKTTDKTDNINKTDNSNKTDNINKISTSTNKRNVPIINEIRHIKREKNHPRTYKGRIDSSMPLGFYTVLDNNIIWWNDFLNYGVDFVKNKYNLKDDTRFAKRKYLVRKILIDNHYDLTKPIVKS